MNAIDVLNAFTRAEEWGVSDLARDLGLSKSVTHRLLQTLAVGGLLLRNRQRGTYLLGPGIATLASAARRSTALVAIARPHLQRLTEATEETTMLAVLFGDRIRYVDGTEPLRQTIRLAVNVGDTQDLHVGSSGRALLAFQPEGFIDDVLAHPLERYTENTITEPALVRADLEQLRRVGWGESHAELTPNSRSVSAPVFGVGGAPVASLSVVGPDFRIGPEEVPQIAELTMRAARELSSELGAPDSSQPAAVAAG